MDSTTELIRLIESFDSKNRKISPATVLTRDLDLSSVEIMEMIEKIEDHFDINFPLNRLEEVNSVAGLAAIIDDLMTGHS